MCFGATLRGLREAAGLSQGQLAERAGISVDSIQNWEQERTRPRIDYLPALAAALRVGTDRLLTPTEPATAAKRGRPAKPKAAEPAPKRRRGRPRKESPAAVPSTQPAGDLEEEAEAVGRKRKGK
jgi:transcriptional regulator with XRE-family HTH domain